MKDFYKMKTSETKLKTRILFLRLVQKGILDICMVDCELYESFKAQLQAVLLKMNEEHVFVPSKNELNEIVDVFIAEIKHLKENFEEEEIPLIFNENNS